MVVVERLSKQISVQFHRAIKLCVAADFSEHVLLLRFNRDLLDVIESTAGRKNLFRRGKAEKSGSGIGSLQDEPGCIIH